MDLNELSELSDVLLEAAMREGRPTREEIKNSKYLDQAKRLAERLDYLIGQEGPREFVAIMALLLTAATALDGDNHIDRSLRDAIVLYNASLICAMVVTERAERKKSHDIYT